MLSNYIVNRHKGFASGCVTMELLFVSLKKKVIKYVDINSGIWMKQNQRELTHAGF